MSVTMSTTRWWAVAVLCVVTLHIGAPRISAQARIARADQGTVELIAVPRAGSGGVVEAGLRFRLQPGWHIYWRNPGDSGGPPTVKWTAPDGVTVSEFSWPTPERIPVGPLVNYGYHGDVVLPFTIRVPASQRDRAFAIKADVRWLVCEEICVPVRSSVVLTWPADTAAGNDSSDWAQLIEAAKRRVPLDAPSSWRATAADIGEALLLTLTPTDAVSTEVRFFPMNVSQIEDAARQVVRRDRGRVELRLEKSAQLARPPQELVGVITIGPGRGYIVTAPVQAGSSNKKGQSR